MVPSERIVGMALPKRMSLWRAVHMAAFQVLACIIVVLARVGYVYGPKFWQSNTAINFIAAWIPALIGVVVAFVPDKDLERHMRLRWRLTVASCFVVWSIVLWHQQTLTEANNKKDREELVAAAVGKSNDHADSKFHDVQQGVDKVHGEIGDVRQHVDATEKDLTSKLDQATSVISANIGKVGKPDPPIPAKLLFTLWDLAATPDSPVLSKIVQPNNDGAFPVEFIVMNVSESTADTVDIWVVICSLCLFVKEPTGFEHLAGADEHIRHRMIGSLNPGVSFEKITILVKSSTPNPFQIALRYSCNNCGGKLVPNQFAIITQGSAAAHKQP
jgi:hypothetical protein